MRKIPPAAYLIPPIFQIALIFSGPLGLSFTSDWGINVLFSVWAISLVALVFYVIHVRKNVNLNRQGKTHWILLLVIGGLAGEIFYWFKHIRRTELA
ncbi:MAG: hypothetical protein RIE86_14720 [Imperialibacter sp.]|uniref:hypothetical protein n=1 Tax=Imperialibacter sp. TaxID=2038411 RepID=UPI0032EAA575